MSRRVGREVIFKTLFELDLNSELDPEAALTLAKDEQDDLTKKDDVFISNVLKGIKEHSEKIDELISSHSHSWELNRIAAVDRAILRLAVYELKFADEELSSNIVINEAVEIAKKYGADESGRFINGILGGIIKDI